MTGLVLTIGITRGLLVLTELEVESCFRFLSFGTATGLDGGVLTALEGRGLRDIEDLKIGAFFTLTYLGFKIESFFTTDSLFSSKT